MHAQQSVHDPRSGSGSRHAEAAARAGDRPSASRLLTGGFHECHDIYTGATIYTTLTPPLPASYPDGFHVVRREDLETLEISSIGSALTLVRRCLPANDHGRLCRYCSPHLTLVRRCLPANDHGRLCHYCSPHLTLVRRCPPVPLLLLLLLLLLL